MKRERGHRAYRIAMPRRSMLDGVGDAALGVIIGAAAAVYALAFGAGALIGAMLAR